MTMSSGDQNLEAVMALFAPGDKAVMIGAGGWINAR